MKYAGIRVLLILLITVQFSQADVDIENSKADRFTLSTYIRMRFSEFGGALTIPDRSFSIESAGFTADFKISREINGQLQLETRPDNIFIKDCYVLWDAFDFLSVRAGRFKKPFCLNTLTSTRNLQTVNHSITHRKLSNLLYSGRDIGSVFILDPGISGLPELSLGIFNGSPDPVNQDNEIQYAARAEFDLLAGITIGTDFTSLRFGEEDYETPDAYTVSERQTAFGGDMQFETEFSNEFSLLLRSEFIRGDNWAAANVITGDAAPGFQTWWFTGGINWKIDKPSLENISAAVSLASWKPDRTVDSREDELAVTLTFDTGTPLTVRIAALNHRPHNILFEVDRTDYILEAALDL